MKGYEYSFMKRSEINSILKTDIDFAKKHKIYFPNFANWNKEDWQNLDERYREIVDNMLGWDVTDFGSGNFEKYGLVAFTFRNGNYNRKDLYPKPYCEKVLFLDEGQELPYHYHKLKEEDTINRGGENLLIKVWNSVGNDLDRESPVTLKKDGEQLTVPAGTTIRLKPGESLTTTQGIYHKWNVEKNTGDVLVWEVSSTNDDKVDNYFYEKYPRIPKIEEDEEPYRVLFGDYDLLNLNFEKLDK